MYCAPGQTGKEVSAMTQVEVLNADETLLHRVSVRHAVKMIWRGIAQAVEVHESATFGPYQVPLVVRLVRFGFSGAASSAAGAAVVALREREARFAPIDSISIFESRARKPFRRR